MSGPGGRAVHLTALGVPVRLDVVGERADEVAAELRTRWHLCLAERPSPMATRISIGLGDRVEGDADTPVDRVRAPELDQLLQITTQAVTRAGIAGNVGRRLMLHAAGIAHPTTGATLACVAPGGTGKTTLCRTLAPRWTYVSDETVAIDADGAVTPYPKPLSLRVPDRLAKVETDPRDLGLRAPEVPAHLVGLVVLERSDDHQGPPRLEPMDLLDAIVTLTPQSSSLSRLERPLHRLADLLERLPVTGRLHYREADSVAGLVEEALA